MVSSNASRQSTHVPSMSKHSARFDELAVILPEQVTQPQLYQLVTRIQALLLASQTMSSINPARPTASVTVQSNSYIRNSDISTARRLLDTLIQTPIADASVLVAITHEESPKLLLTRRAGHLNSHAGEVSFAGGKYESSDANNMVTALREACEETALPPSKVHIVGQLPTQTSKSGMSVRPIVALIDPEVTYVPELGEIERIFWADLLTLIDQPTEEYRFAYTQPEHSKQSGHSVTLTTPSWLVDGETVWGLTARIIASLLEVGFDRKIEWYYRQV